MPASAIKTPFFLSETPQSPDIHNQFQDFESLFPTSFQPHIMSNLSPIPLDGNEIISLQNVIFHSP
jgi:hypothetical protein